MNMRKYRCPRGNDRGLRWTLDVPKLARTQDVGPRRQTLTEPMVRIGSATYEYHDASGGDVRATVKMDHLNDAVDHSPPRGADASQAREGDAGVDEIVDDAVKEVEGHHEMSREVPTDWPASS